MEKEKNPHNLSGFNIYIYFTIHSDPFKISRKRGAPLPSNHNHGADAHHRPPSRIPARTPIHHLYGDHEKPHPDMAYLYIGLVSSHWADLGKYFRRHSTASFSSLFVYNCFPRFSLWPRSRAGSPVRVPPRSRAKIAPRKPQPRVVPIRPGVFPKAGQARAARVQRHPGKGG